MRSTNRLLTYSVLTHFLKLLLQNPNATHSTCNVYERIIFRSFLIDPKHRIRHNTTPTGAKNNFFSQTYKTLLYHLQTCLGWAET